MTASKPVCVCVLVRACRCENEPQKRARYISLVLFVDILEF